MNLIRLTIPLVLNDWDYSTFNWISVRGSSRNYTWQDVDKVISCHFSPEMRNDKPWLDSRKPRKSPLMPSTFPGRPR